MVPVVVVGGDLNALGVVRSLAPSKIPVYLASDASIGPAALSRFATNVRISGFSDRALIDSLKQVASAVGQKAVLILTGDTQVTAVSEAREELEPLFYFALPSKESVRLLADKSRFQRYAETVGFAVPRAVLVTGQSDPASIASLSLPMVLKPADKALVLAGLVERAVRVETLDEANTVAARMLRNATCVLAQEWIEGNDDDLYFTLFVCDTASRVIALFAGRKMICEPPQVGSTALCIAAGAAHDELAELTRRFIGQVHYQGIGGLEFKRDRRANRYVMVEPTVGRTDWQEEIATLCGVNLPEVAYRTLLGESGAAVPAVDRRVAWRSSIAYRPRSGVLAAGTRIFDGYFRLDDPLPGLHYYIVTAFFVRLWQSVRRRAGFARAAAPA